MTLSVWTSDKFKTGSHGVVFGPNIEVNRYEDNNAVTWSRTSWYEPVWKCCNMMWLVSMDIKHHVYLLLWCGSWVQPRWSGDQTRGQMKMLFHSVILGWLNQWAGQNAVTQCNSWVKHCWPKPVHGQHLYFMGPSLPVWTSKQMKMLSHDLLVGSDLV